MDKKIISDAEGALKDLQVKCTKANDNIQKLGILRADLRAVLDKIDVMIRTGKKVLTKEQKSAVTSFESTLKELDKVMTADFVTKHQPLDGYKDIEKEFANLKKTNNETEFNKLLSKIITYSNHCVNFIEDYKKHEDSVIILIKNLDEFKKGMEKIKLNDTEGWVEWIISFLPSKTDIVKTAVLKMVDFVTGLACAGLQSYIATLL